MQHNHKLPNSRFCFACGMENEIGLKLAFYSDGQGGVVGEYTIPKHFEGYPGVAHGGIVTTLMDEALVRAFLLEDENRMLYTAKLTARFRKHVPVQVKLKITARAVNDRQRLGEAIAKVFGPDGDLLAEAQGLMVAVPKADLQNMDLEELGWRVYSDEELAS